MTCVIAQHDGGVLTAEELALTLPRSVVQVVCVGRPEKVTGLEFHDDEVEATLHTGDLLLAPGPVPDLAPLRAAAGLVVRRRAADAALQERCRDLGLTLLALTDGTSWSVALALLQTAIEADRRAGSTDDGSFDELFAMAEHIGRLIDAPVTIEDAQSRVLAYSGRQDATDEARVSTIIGRRVPREVRDHFRAHGVFRRLATSDEPFFVEQGPPGVRPRYVVPVRAGGEWLGSIWAVVDSPVPPERLPELAAAADVVALHVLRLRTRSELGRQLSVEQVRAALRGVPSEVALPPGPWRVVALAGPGTEESPETRRELWTALARRRGWASPLVADLADDVFALVAAEGNQPGSWQWWADLVTAQARRDPTVAATAGLPVGAVADLPATRSRAVELLGLTDSPASTAEQLWASATLARTRRAVGDLHSPVAALRAHDARNGTRLTDTLAAVLDHWAEPRRSARTLGVHANTVRYRMEQVRTVLGAHVDLDDPRDRLALRLHLLDP